MHWIDHTQAELESVPVLSYSGDRLVVPSGVSCLRGMGEYPILGLAKYRSWARIANPSRALLTEAWRWVLGKS